MKYSLFSRALIFTTILITIWACSSSFNTSDLGPEERLKYAIGLYEDEDYQEASAEFETLMLQYPGSVIIDDAQYYLGLCKFKRGEYILAAYEFSKLIKNMPASELVADAQFMLAESYYELSPNYNLDQKYTTKAIEEYQAFIDFFPLNEKVSEAEKKIDELNNKLAMKEYNIAVIYEKLEYYTAALKYFDSVIETYHDTPYASKSMYNKILLLASRNRNEEALSEMNKFLKLYPNDSNYKEIDELRKSLEEKTGSYSSN
jgi:outer membrane protein assembly factor BamD